MAEGCVCDNGIHHTLKIEARDVMREVAYAVKSVEISKAVPSTDELVFMDLCTKENQSFCVELSVRGFRVVSDNFDVVDEESETYFETIYGLLDHVSPEYRNSFGDALFSKLESLEKQQVEPEEHL